MLLERLREYEGQEKALDVRCQELEDELYSRKRGFTEVDSMQSGVAEEYRTHIHDSDEGKENVWPRVQDGGKGIGTPLIKPRIKAKIRDRVAMGPSSTKAVSLV
ncbi:hypothetical protein SERLA73DRAFT_187751, partial [Serpula lacrymans var. lacrymans S7.3]